MVIDASINRKSLLSSSSLTSLGHNWVLPIVGFFSLFVLVYGFHATEIPNVLWRLSVPTDPDDVLTISKLVAIVMVASSVFGLVPTSVLLRLLLTSDLRRSESTPSNATSGLTTLGSIATPFGSSLPAPSFQTILYLTWALSVSGLTSLTSSVANSVVAQKSREILRIRTSYFQHLLYGLPVSLLFGTTGICIISISFRAF